MYIVLVYRILAICPMNVNNDDNNNSLICRYSSLVLSRQYNIYYNVPLLDSHNRAEYSTKTTGATCRADLGVSECPGQAGLCSSTGQNLEITQAWSVNTAQR